MSGGRIGVVPCSDYHLGIGQYWILNSGNGKNGLLSPSPEDHKAEERGKRKRRKTKNDKNRNDGKVDGGGKITTKIGRYRCLS